MHWRFNTNRLQTKLQNSGSGNAQPFTSKSSTFLFYLAAIEGCFCLTFILNSHHITIQSMQKQRNIENVLREVRNDCLMTASAVTLSSLMLTNSLNTTNHDMLVIYCVLLMLSIGTSCSFVVTIGIHCD